MSATIERGGALFRALFFRSSANAARAARPQVGSPASTPSSQRRPGSTRQHGLKIPLPHHTHPKYSAVSRTNEASLRGGGAATAPGEPILAGVGLRGAVACDSRARGVALASLGGGVGSRVSSAAGRRVLFVLLCANYFLCETFL